MRRVNEGGVVEVRGTRMSLDSNREMVSGRANTAAPSSVDAGRPEAYRSYAVLRHSLYGILLVLTDRGLYGASGRELGHAE
jgi:hypothetical protein